MIDRLHRRHGSVVRKRALAPVLLAVLALFALCGATAAAKEVIAYFGTSEGAGTKGGEFSTPGDIAVNSSGAGPADERDVYVLDFDNRRVQRFAQNDAGTPSDPYDDAYEFISAWGADVDASPAGGSDFEICTVAAQCKAGVASGGNGSAAGNGALSDPTGIAVDQDTGDVYVADRANFRVNVYSGNGTFLRSFGWDVVASGPDQSGTGYEVCVSSLGDVCKAGVTGAGLGQMAQARSIAVSPADGNPATGTVFVGDALNTRVDTFALDGSAPASFGSSAQFDLSRLNAIAVDSRGIVYVGDLNNQQEIDRYDTENANGGGVGFLTSIPAPPVLPSNHNGSIGFEVDPDSDGPGPDVDVLYVLRTVSDPGAVSSVVQQFGPVNAPGLTAPPTAADATHGSLAEFNFTLGLGLDSSRERLFVSTKYNVGGKFDDDFAGSLHGVYVLDTAGGAASATLDSVSDVTARSATVNGTVNPNGPPTASYRLEYSLDGVEWMRTPDVPLGSQTSPQPINAVLQPPGGGLESGTLYHVRLVATRPFNPPAISSSTTFTTLPRGPEVETVGSPVRTAVTAELEGRVNPVGSATTYHFEYGADGPCDANPCQSTAPLVAGSGKLTEFVSQQVDGLQSGTTYHYRVVADNGNDGPSFGEDMTVSTRASDAPLTHGEFAGPPGSDRAWELVSLDDTGGTPVIGATAGSDDGERVVYQISGGTPISDSGSGFSQLFASRTSAGWLSEQLSPPRSQVAGPSWLIPFGDGGLTGLTNLNFDQLGHWGIWRLIPGAPDTELVGDSAAAYGDFFAASDDASRTLAMLSGAADPVHPASTDQLYDISSGTPQLATLLPGDQLPTCKVPMGSSGFTGGLPTDQAQRSTRWLSADGSRLFFPSPGLGSCSNPNQLYVRDFGAAETKLISGPALSGLSCFAGLIKSTEDAAFFWTPTRLTADDTPTGSCGGSVDGDVYRYDLGDESLECVTCVVPGIDADVLAENTLVAGMGIAVAEDGSRVYFRSPHRLTAGAAEPGAYRINVASGDLAYVAPGSKVNTGEFVKNLNALTPDGSVLLFASADPALNPLNGSDNGGTLQYYRYDDRDRSLLCVSCPPDGSPAPEAAVGQLSLQQAEGVGPNVTPLSDDGDVAFATPNGLVSADQNTAGSDEEGFAGTDVYEWRDGRLLMVSDGITTWPALEVAPAVGMVSPSGRDVFFTASAQLTPDAVDGYNRLYDARIGGGIPFVAPPQPCSLEVCQGTPKGAPEGIVPGSGTFAGAGNLPQPPRRCPKGARKVKRAGKIRCVKRHKHRPVHKQARNQKRRSSR